MIDLNNNATIKQLLNTAENSDKCNYFIYNDQGSIYVKPPRVYDCIETQVSEKYIEEYLSDILNDNMRVSFINGLSMSINFYLCVECNTFIEDDDYYYCYECQRDFCNRCMSSHNHSNNVVKRSTNEIPPIACDFGSLLDWIPVVVDDDDNRILVNANPDSIYRGKYALSACDDHNRQGYYLIIEKTTLDRLVTEMKSFTENDNNDDEPDNPILKMMLKCNMEIDYG